CARGYYGNSAWFAYW
nr:immunoglobulin heavy chain junction region [Mus musculus]